MDAIAQRLCRAWGFTPTEELAAGHCSRVYADATRVLKVPWRGEEIDSGHRAALRMQGRLGPRVLQHDAGTGALLMDRLLPGRPLAASSLGDDDRIAITVAFLRETAQLDATDMLPLHRYYTAGSPQLRELLATTASACFLHGDLHPDNILSHAEGWLPIDPKGLVGDPCFEPVAYLRNCIDLTGGARTATTQLAHRLDAFASGLALDSERIAAWLWLDRTLDVDAQDAASPELAAAIRTLLRDRGWGRWLG